MDTKNRNSTNRAPQRVSLSGSASFEPPTASAYIKVFPADDIEVEDSTTLKYLRLKNGDFTLPKSVFLVANGKRTEITLDALPETERQ